MYIDTLLTLQMRLSEMRPAAKQPRNELSTTKDPTKICTTTAMCSKVRGEELFSSKTDSAISATPISCETNSN